MFSYRKSRAVSLTVVLNEFVSEVVFSESKRKNHTIKSNQTLHRHRVQNCSLIIENFRIIFQNQNLFKAICFETQTQRARHKNPTSTLSFVKNLHGLIHQQRDVEVSGEVGEKAQTLTVFKHKSKRVQRNLLMKDLPRVQLWLTTDHKQKLRNYKLFSMFNQS